MDIPFTVDQFFDAVAKDDLRLVRLFHISGIDLNVKSQPYGYPAIYRAVDRDSYRVFRYLIENGIDVNARCDWNGRTALSKAVAAKNYEMIYALIRAGAYAVGEVNNGDIYSPLSYALLKPQTLLVKTLLENGASVNESYYRRNVKPLMVAAENVSAHVVKVLLDAGASVKDIDVDGMTALHYALQPHASLSEKKYKPTFDITRLLIGAGANVNHASHNGITPIILASWLKDKYIVQLLLDHGANPNVKFQAKDLFHMPFIFLWKNSVSLSDAVLGGVTPLMLSAFLGDEQLTELLLQHGANPLIISTEHTGSYTAEKLALEQGHKNLAKKIVSYHNKFETNR